MVGFLPIAIRMPVNSDNNEYNINNSILASDGDKFIEIFTPAGGSLGMTEVFARFCEKRRKGKGKREKGKGERKYFLINYEWKT